MSGTGELVRLSTGEEVTLDYVRERIRNEHLDEKGREEMDPTPLAPPIGYKKQPSMVDIIRDMVRSERVKLEAQLAGYESFEEANDFSVEDDDFPVSPHEQFEDETPIGELRRRLADFQERERKGEIKPPDPAAQPDTGATAGTKPTA